MSKAVDLGFDPPAAVLLSLIDAVEVIELTATTNQGGDGNDYVSFNGTGTAASFMGGNGADGLYFFSAAAWNPNIVFNGGEGTNDELYFGVSNATFDLRAAVITNVEEIYAAGSNTTLLVDRRRQSSCSGDGHTAENHAAGSVRAPRTARTSIRTWLERRGGGLDEFAFPSRVDRSDHLSTHQSARLVDEWVSGIGLRREDYGTHSLRRTKAALIYKQTGNLRAVQFFSGTLRLRAPYVISGSIPKTH